MKKNITQITLGTLFCLAATQTQAQLKLSAAIGPQFPTGDFGKVFKTGFGFTATGRYLIRDKFAVGLNIGYNGFGAKGAGDVKASMLPVTALFEYHFHVGKLRPYAGLDMGLSRYAISVSSGGMKTTSSETSFALAPSIGTFYELNDRFALAGNLKLTRVFANSAASWIGINLGAAYSL